MKDKEFIGVVLGGDMNSYAVARAFYEAYEIKTVILGQNPIFPTAYKIFLKMMSSFRRLKMFLRSIRTRKKFFSEIQTTMCATLSITAPALRL